MAFFSHPSVKFLLSIGVASCIGLTGCNKLGYGEPRTAPEGQAVLGPKRMPQMNQQEIQRQQQAFQTGQSQQMQAQSSRPAPQMQPQPMPMQQMPPQQQAPQPQPPQIPANYPVTPVGPQGSANNPYANGSQSYQMPNQQRQQHLQQQQQMQSQQGAYQLPQNYPAGSYYGAQQSQQPQQAMARTVSANPTDYYMQDMLQQPLPVIMGQAQQGQHYHQAVPVGQVQGGNLSPVSLQDYQAGFAMEAAYGRYQQQMPAVPPQPNATQPYQQPQSYYQPMNATQAELYPALDPYTAELNQPEYNNYFYGGEGMPQGHDTSRFAPNFEAAAQGQAMTNGFGQRASGMINSPASNERYLGESLRRPLEEPPMLGVQSELPNPNPHSQLHYGNGSYR